MITVVLRNIIRNLSRLTPMIVVIVVVFTAMFLGNAVLRSSGAALRQTYARHVAGDMSVSARGEQNFTIFGSDQLLVGNYVVPPTLTDFATLQRQAEALDGVAGTAGLISAIANVEISGVDETRTVFGVDFARYAELFPDLVLAAGAVPAPGAPGILVQEDYVPAGGQAQDILGRPALLATGRGSSFTLREVPVTGVFRYPVSDELLDRIVLVDADTARALNGYVYGAAAGDAGTPSVGDSADGVGTDDLDALFGESATQPETPAEPDDTGGVDLTSLFDDTAPADTEKARATVAGAWNFLLIALETDSDRRRVERELAALGYTPEEGYRVRDWAATVGGSAAIVRYLQLFFNIGLVFVAVGAAIISTNALMLSVLERTKEIGTMRALGAGAGRVAMLIAAETVIVVLGAVVIGVGAGVAATRYLNTLGYVIDNRYIEVLFGGGPIRGRVTWSLVASHLGAGVVLAVLSVLYPLRRALRIRPHEAMAA